MMNLKEKVLSLSKGNDIVINTMCGLRSYKIDEICNQPLDGLLYDLNRDEATLLTLMEDPSCRWSVNSYATTQCLRYFKNEMDRYKALYETLKGNGDA